MDINEKRLTVNSIGKIKAGRTSFKGGAYFYLLSPEILTAWQKTMEEDLATSKKINSRYLYGQKDY